MSFRRFRRGNGGQRVGLQHPAHHHGQRERPEGHHHSNRPAREPADHRRDVAAVFCDDAARTAEYEWRAPSDPRRASAAVSLTVGLFSPSVLAVPANTVTEEVMTEEPQPPPSRKRKLEVTNNHSDAGETVSAAQIRDSSEICHQVKLSWLFRKRLKSGPMKSFSLGWLEVMFCSFVSAPNHIHRLCPNSKCSEFLKTRCSAGKSRTFM